MILGIDEVGRGPWAGPLVVGAVVLGDADIKGLTDSKKLSKSRREQLSAEITAKAAAYGIGWVDAEELDSIGLSESLRLATRRAVELIHAPYHEIIIDGTVNFLDGTSKEPYVTTLKKADLLIASVSAASIIAKVARDDYMSEQDELYPEYGFVSHVGYGTAKHRDAMLRQGLTPLHRKSFAPVAAMLADAPLQPVAQTDTTTNKYIGGIAETIAAEMLQKDGYEMIARNWKTRFCEIDIIAAKANRLYFVEVKHRKNARQGSGIDAISQRKYRQMEFAARIYLQYTKSNSKDVSLMVVTTKGEPPVFESVLELTEGR